MISIGVRKEETGVQWRAESRIVSPDFGDKGVIAIGRGQTPSAAVGHLVWQNQRALGIVVEVDYGA